MQGSNWIRRNRRWIITGSLAVIAGIAVWLFWFSSVFAVTKVSVIGADGVAAQEVQDLAGIASGTPMARVDADAVQRRLASVPWLASVEVRRLWPDEIALAVTERSPVALVRRGSQRVAVDEQAVLFTPPSGLPTDLVTITATTPAGLNESVDVWGTLPPDIAERVTRIAATTRDDVRLHLRSGAVVRWGNAKEAQFKSQVLRALLPQKARIYDVSAPSLPTTVGEKKN